MSTKKILLIALGILALLILACGSDQSGSKVDEQETKPMAKPTKIEPYKIGDVIAVKDHTIVLNSATIQDSMLEANFTIENNGDEDLNISSMLSFSAKDEEGTKLEQEIFDCGPGLDGKVLPADKLKGDICWKGAKTDTVKIYYEASLLGSGAIVWMVSK